MKNDINSDTVNENFNSQINQDEILKAVKRAKIINHHHVITEFIAFSLDFMVNIYEDIFHIAFDTGILPGAWLI